MLERLGNFIYRRRRLVLIGTVPAVLLMFAIGGPVFGKLTSGGRSFEAPSSESAHARKTLEGVTGSNPDIGVIALVRVGEDPRSSSGRAKVEEVASTIASDPAIADVDTLFTTNNPAFVSKDGNSTYVVASYKPISARAETDAAERLLKAFEDRPDVKLGGASFIDHEIDERTGKDIARAEAFGIPILILLSLLFFRGFIAALLPFAIALISIAGSLLLIRITNSVLPLSIFCTNLITGLGVGLSIDYSLFIVSRYREELASVGPGTQAIARTLTTAGRTVLFSALTVAAAMSALFVFPQKFLYSMGFGGVFVSLVAAVASLVVLPAILAALGTRVNALSPKRLRLAAERTARGEQGAWYSIAHWVMRRAVPVATITAVLLIVLGIPFTKIKFTGIDAAVLPTSTIPRQVQDTLSSEFNVNRTSPVYLAVEASQEQDAAIQSFQQRLRSLPNVINVSSADRLTPQLVRIDVFSSQRALDGATQDLVSNIRDISTPFSFLAGGQAPAYKDQQASFQESLPWALLIVVLTTGTILFLMTGSLILPFKTLLMNFLSLSATLGFLVLVFQDARFESLLSYTSQHALNAAMPILIGAIAFALSTDYAVFLLTRIKEARDQGIGDTEAVAVGLERTGRIVTAAALMLAVAIGAFVTSDIIVIKMLGLGVAFAVLLDATVVRALLVPSLMKLLGPWNWWAPKPLRRLHDRIGLREATTDAPSALGKK